MSKTQQISQLYKILLLYEDIINNKPNISKEDYIKYLDRLYIYWIGVGNNEIFNIIHGLKILELNTNHQTVKSMVFHMINLISRGE